MCQARSLGNRAADISPKAPMLLLTQTIIGVHLHGIYIQVPWSSFHLLLWAPAKSQSPATLPGGFLIWGLCCVPQTLEPAHTPSVCPLVSPAPPNQQLVLSGCSWSRFAGEVAQTGGPRGTSVKVAPLTCGQFQQSLQEGACPSPNPCSNWEEEQKI